MYLLFSAIALMLALTIGGPAFAAGAEAQAPASASREQYRGCLDFQERLTVLLKNLDEHVAENNNTIALLQSDALALAEAQKTMSPFDQSQVDAFNNRMSEHNSKVASANEQAERVKSEHEAYHKETIEYNKRCATLAVRLDDRDAVLKERDASVKPPAQQGEGGQKPVELATSAATPAPAWSAER